MQQQGYFLLQTSQGEIHIAHDSIIRIQAMSNYCKIHFANGKVLVISKVLQWFDDKLNAYNFVRVHRSHLVNHRYINNVEAKERKLLILKDNSKVEISRRKKTAVEKKLQMLARA